jgi:predicted methyltransferase
MRSSAGHAACATLLALASEGCTLGPEPKDASTANVPIYNTAAVVEDVHTVADVTPSPRVLALLAARDRDARDVSLDARYQAAELLTFLDIRPGDHVASLTAGGGYFTELFARAVAPDGLVFANQPPAIAARLPAASALEARLERPVNADVMASGRELAAPLPDYATNLDLVYLSMPYRTVERLGVSTSEMDRAVFAALKPGGRFVLLDFRPHMTGPSRANLHELHAKEAASVRRQAESAGFRFVTEARFLHDDPRPYEWAAIGAPDPTALEESDRFLLKFVKP